MPKALHSWPVALLAILALYPLFPGIDQHLFNLAHRSLGDQLTGLFTFALLALALNVVVGNTGVFHLGIAAFFGIGAYVSGILTVPAYPFQVGFWPAAIAGTIAATAAGVALGLPSLRLRGDYLALVTLGFGEVVRFTIKNVPAVTRGSDGLSPVPAPSVPFTTWDWHDDYRPFYYLALIALATTYVLLGRIERSKLGRAWVAIREDELAATCMGLNANRLKLAAFAVAAAIAGMAGALYASKMTTTSGPDAYDFNKSVFALCCVILGGLGSRNGVLLGVALLYGFDNILSPILDAKIQEWRGESVANVYQTFSGWRLMLFGLVLILVMRFRPEGLLPNDRVKDELAHGQ
jgi:branched-chain amino acid transport system permease protein